MSETDQKPSNYNAACSVLLGKACYFLQRVVDFKEIPVRWSQPAGGYRDRTPPSLGMRAGILVGREMGTIVHSTHRGGRKAENGDQGQERG